MASTFRVIGTNVYTNNRWTCEAGITTRAEAAGICRSFIRLESETSIEYSVEAE